MACASVGYAVVVVIRKQDDRTRQRLPAPREAPRSRPFGNLVAFGVPEVSDNEPNEIDGRPDPEPTQGQQLKYACGLLADIEAVPAKDAEGEAENHRRQELLLRLVQNRQQRMRAAALGGHYGPRR